MKIRYHRNFDKQYRKAPLKIREQFKERRNLFITDSRHPLLDDHELDHEWVGCRSFNVTGDWRAIYEVHLDSFIEFHALGTHHQLYGT